MQTRRIVAFGLIAAAALFAKAPVPRATKDFRMADRSLADYRGKVLVVQFLYTTCAHCQATAQMLTKLQQDLGPRGLQVLGVAFNEETARPEAVRNFVSANHVGFPVSVATPAQVLDYLGIPVVTRFAVPQIVIIDRGGTVRAQSEPLGSSELQNEAYLRTFLDGLLKSK